MIYLELEWNGEGPYDDVRQRQVGDEQVGDGAHPPAVAHHVDHKAVA